MYYGLRGVGKTVLLNRINLEAEGRGIACVKIEAPEGRSLPSLLVGSLRVLLLKLNKIEKAKDVTSKAFRALASFVGAFKVKYGDMEIAINFDPEVGVADSGDLGLDIAELLELVGLAAKAAATSAVIFIDEIQYVESDEMASLIAALHDVSQKALPVAVVGAGLPQLLGKMGAAKSYAERLFEFVPIDRLDAKSAVDALCVPARRAAVEFEKGAIDEIIGQTLGYPYFLQEWGKHSWNVADDSPITAEDARTATTAALAELDMGFFRVRFDRCTPAEKAYLRAMADLGGGPHRSGDIATRLGKQVQAVAPTRNSLILKGMVYSPAHGDTAFTVPLFDGFMRRLG